MVCTVPPLYKRPHLKQYCTTTTPLASKQYSTYAVTIVPFSCLPREAPLFARDPHFPPGMPFKLLGYIYTIPTIYFLCDHLHHSDINCHLLRRHIYIFLCGDIYIIGTSRNGNLWRSPSVASTRTISNVSFCFLSFVFLLTVVFNKD